MSIEQIKLYLLSLDFPWDIALLPPTAYLVGGSVRDALLQRYKTPLDLDFVLPDNTIAIAKKIANFYQAGFVVLDKEREIARVVFPQGTLDFARQEGDSLEADLKRRDFTINAIAYCVSSPQLIDPLGGVKDLQQKVLRMVAPNNLDDDPLRLLRAYRQAAQLDLRLEENTRQAISDRVELLSTIAAERIQAELNYIFVTPRGDKWLTTAAKDGLLKFWLPSIDCYKLQQLNKIEKAIEFCRNLGLDLAELSILSKLATLVSTEEIKAEAELIQLKYSRSEIKAVVKTVKHLPQLQTMKQDMSLREQYFWFLDVRDVFPLLMVRAIATGVSWELLKPLVERYLDPQDSVAYPQSLVTGNDLIKELNIKPSPMIGKLLTEIQIAQIESKIFTQKQALDFARSMLKSLA